MNIGKEHIKPSPFYEVYDKNRNIIRCTICERKCVLAPGTTGICWNHRNIDGKLYNIAYGMLSAVEPRPIEVKPLFHYYPNSLALTFSGWGCNFRCPWCQNYHISWSKPDYERSTYKNPEELVELAKKLKNHGLCASFNEPAIHLEYLLDTGTYATKEKLYLTMVTNGYMSSKTIKLILEHGYTGFSIDIKGCPDTYKRFLSADPLIIYRNAKTILDYGGHVEMVYLVVPKANDWRECYEWIIDNHLKYLGEEVPLHINRYYPANKYYEPPTQISKLLEIKQEAERAGIEYVYVGNTPYEKYEYTYCPRCGKALIARRFYRVVKWNLTKDSRCPRCGYKINIYGKYEPT